MPLPKICACLIVRNEEETFERLARSLEGLADYWVVVDTGSTDSTLDVVRASFSDIPGELHERPWVNFGHNRSELMALAHGKAEWLLLIDADMVAQGSLKTEELDPLVDAYLLEHAGDPSDWIPGVVRGDRGWRFDGVTYEYLTPLDDASHTRATLPGLSIEHVADGGSRSDKFERDRALLEQEVAQQPDDSRSWFYLGRTYADRGEPLMALKAFRTRVHLGGWNEESYYAQFEVGNALIALGDADAAVSEWLRAWEMRPERLEALHAAVRELRTRGLHHAAFALADAVIGQPMPDDVLFLRSDIWEFELPLEHSICAYYVRGPRACLAESEALLAMPDVPSAVREFAASNAELCRRDVGLLHA